MKSLLVCLVIISCATVGRAAWETSGEVEQAYQTRQQLFNPTVIKPWLSDAVTSATPTTSQSEAVTEITTRFVADWPIGLLTLGLYGKLVWAARQVDHYWFRPVIQFIDDHQEIKIGRIKPRLFGSGLAFHNFTMTGIDYQYRWQTLTSHLYFFNEFERTEFNREQLLVGGFTQRYEVANWLFGLMGLYDASPEFEDSSRGKLSKGTTMSANVNWRGQGRWTVFSELAYNQHVAWLLGIDYLVLNNLELETRIRLLGEGYNPIFSRYAREGDQQSQISWRIPITWFQDQLLCRPQWGIKRTRTQDFWVPAIKIDVRLFQRLLITGEIVAEQPMDQWGAKDHYEYTAVKVVGIIGPQLSLNGEWRKTYNGFLNWKEIQSQINMEWQW